MEMFPTTLSTPRVCRFRHFGVSESEISNLRFRKSLAGFEPATSSSASLRSHPSELQAPKRKTSPFGFQRTKRAKPESERTGPEAVPLLNSLYRFRVESWEREIRSR